MSGAPSLGYRGALDGIRAVAVLAVMFHHADVLGVQGGGAVGVETFFVLSGFLITTLMVEEHIATGAVSLRHFYARRVLRLLPALLTVVTFVGIWAAFEGNRRTLVAIPGVALYAANWVEISGRSLGLLGHTWSLAVEEQFYVVWPAIVVVVLAVTRSYARLARLALALALASTAARVALWRADTSIQRVRDGFDSRAAGLLFGAAAAILVATGPQSVRRKLAAAAPFAALAGAGTLFALSFSRVNARSGYAWGIGVVQAAALAVVVGVVAAPSSPVARLLATMPLRQIGRVSYGLYLWHFPVFMVLTRRYDLARPLNLVLEFALTIALTVGSFLLIERPALRLKDRFAAPARQVVETPVGPRAA